MKSLRKITEGRTGISESYIPSDRLIVTVVVETKVRRKIWQFIDQISRHACDASF